MADQPSSSNSELSSFMSTGVYSLDGSRILFLDPVRILNESYTGFVVSPSAYYSRSFDPRGPVRSTNESYNANKRKRNTKQKKKKHAIRGLNDREKAAEQRHKEVRHLLIKAHELLLGASELVSLLPVLMKGEELSTQENVAEVNFVDLGCRRQAPLSEMILDNSYSTGGSSLNKNVEKKAIEIFDNFIINEADHDLQAGFLQHKYILPRNSCLYMSDLRQVHNLIPAHPDHGYNLIVIDPPWENGSVNQKLAYPMLPNRYFLYLPIKQLVHEDGALLVLWMTNREKLHRFVEEELFPAWGVTNITSSYWLKVKPDGSLLGELDLFHHRPYERVLLGYVNVKTRHSQCKQRFRYIESPHIFLSIPGAHSRKPRWENYCQITYQALNLQDVLSFLLENWWLDGPHGEMNPFTSRTQDILWKEQAQTNEFSVVVLADLICHALLESQMLRLSVEESSIGVHHHWSANCHVFVHFHSPTKLNFQKIGGSQRALKALVIF